jgi:hypothetical protein
MEVRCTGVAIGTLVHTARGCRPINNLAAGEHVWSFDPKQCLWRLTGTRDVTVRSLTIDMCYLHVAGEYLALAADHLVWVAKDQTPAARGGAGPERSPEEWRGQWVQARALEPGASLLSRVGVVAVMQPVLRRCEVLCVAEIETSDPHTFAVGTAGILVHNRTPALAAGQIHTLTAQHTGAQHVLTLPPIDESHVFDGCILPGGVLHGLHHIAGPYVIQQAVAFVVPGHGIMVPGPGGAQVARTVDLRVTPALSVTGDAPFAARIDVIDPATNAVLGTKNSSSFFPLNWTRAQVIQAIYEAFTNYVVATELPPVGRGLAARTDGGVRLLLHVATQGGGPGMISSGYPHGPQPLVTAAHAPQ